MKPALAYQPDLFTGEALRDEGLMRAVTHADKEIPKWSERVYEIFKKWLSEKPKGYSFLMESFRLHVEIHKLIEPPPNNRAYGIISRKALAQELVYQRNTGKTTNPKSHCANAALLVKK